MERKILNNYSIILGFYRVGYSILVFVLLLHSNSLVASDNSGKITLLAISKIDQIAVIEFDGDLLSLTVGDTIDDDLILLNIDKALLIFGSVKSEVRYRLSFTSLVKISDEAPKHEVPPVFRTVVTKE